MPQPWKASHLFPRFTAVGNRDYPNTDEPILTHQRDNCKSWASDQRFESPLRDFSLVRRVSRIPRAAIYAEGSSQHANMSLTSLPAMLPSRVLQKVSQDWPLPGKDFKKGHICHAWEYLILNSCPQAPPALCITKPPLLFMSHVFP